MVHNPPQVLCIQLLRFDANGQKINQKVDYSPELTVPNYRDGSTISTTLSSTIVHEGNQISSGHYVCYVNRSGRWFYTSDTVVKEVSQLAAYHQAAYMLFYEKVQQKEDFMSGQASETNMFTKEAVLVPPKSKERDTNINVVGIQAALPKGSLCLYRRNAKLFLQTKLIPVVTKIRSPCRQLLDVHQSAFRQRPQ